MVALDGVDFSVGPGRMTGFVGANGAGKTTTMRIILGVTRADAGTVTWQGHQLDAALRRRIGYMPEERGLYPKMPVESQLVYLARLHGVAKDTARERVRSLLERLGLADRAGDRLDALSLGNQQRVQVAASLAHDPVLLVLDEPFSGLDPRAVDVMAELLREQVDRGVPVLFSSHQLELVERVCDDLVVVDSGRVVAAGPAQELRSRYATGRYRLECDPAPLWLGEEEGVTVLSVEGRRALVDLGEADSGAAQRLLDRARDRGRVISFGPDVRSLAEIFREVTR